MEVTQVIPDEAVEARASLVERLLKVTSWALFLLWVVLAVVLSAWQAYRELFGGGL